MKKTLPYSVYGLVSIAAFVVLAATIHALASTLSDIQLAGFAFLVSQPIAIVAAIATRSNVNNEIYWNAYNKLHIKMMQNPTDDYKVELKKLKALIKSDSHLNAYTRLVDNYGK